METQALSYVDSSDRDVADHLEAFLAKRDGVDKLIKLCRYAAKLAIASVVADDYDLNHRLKCFESSVGVSQKALRFGGFVQHINALRPKNLKYSGRKETIVLRVLVHGGEGIKSFLDQFLWLMKTGLTDGRYAAALKKIAAWADLMAHVGGIPAKLLDLRAIIGEMVALKSTVERLRLEGLGFEKEEMKLRRLREKLVLRRLSIIQESMDTLMVIGDLQQGKGFLSKPLVLACLGFLSALISAHKNWTLC